MKSFDVLVKGSLLYVGPSGDRRRVPHGPCKAVVHEGYVSLTWLLQGAEHTAVIKWEALEDHLESGALLMLAA